MQHNKEQNPQRNINHLQKHAKKLLQNSAVLYAMVGVINTIVGHWKDSGSKGVSGGRNNFSER